jgi:hypothetical protein
LKQSPGFGGSNNLKISNMKLNFKDQFLLSVFLSQILKNSEKQFENSNMNYVKKGIICFDDEQKKVMEKIISDYDLVYQYVELSE